MDLRPTMKRKALRVDDHALFREGVVLLGAMDSDRTRQDWRSAAVAVTIMLGHQTVGLL